MLGACGLVVNAAWLAYGLSDSERPIVQAVCVLLAWAVCAALAWRWWRALPRGELAWEGGQWTFAPAGPAEAMPLQGPPAVRLDLQSAMLLHARGVRGPALWLWLRRAPGSGGAAWPAIRRALYSRALQAPLPASEEARPSPETPG